MKCAIFSCLGLGDGLIASVLGRNLKENGHEVVIFHPFLNQVERWFPGISFRPFPPDLTEFDRYFVIYERSPWMQAVLDECLSKFRAQTTVLNPIATPNTDYPFWEEGRFDGNKTFVENLYVFSRDILKLPHASDKSGLVIPSEITPRRFPQRVIIHPTSSRPGKNWSRHKFLRLAEKLKKGGFDPVFTVGPKEQAEWPEGKIFPSLDELFVFVAESGAMIGNDSGIGHLASACGLPTLTLCRNQRTADFWHPYWAQSEVCLPSGWLPNIKGMRWRDEKWQWGLSVRRVYSTFLSLANRSTSERVDSVCGKKTS
ncbi:MAG: hypothetical protein JSR58_01800 [Verrucomicrobia bacterium]|nr:hypothetical protein [Verrucomicrobiota bacterium]